MQPKARSTILIRATLALVIALVALGGTAPRQAVAAPEAVVTFDLYTMAGTLSLPGPATVNIWGYALSAAGPATLPGPLLVVTQGDTVNITLHNGLAVTTSLTFEAQSLVPDLVGVAPGATGLYTFVATDPGIFLYEAGPLAGAAYQPSMGLHGALIVRPALGANYAYNDPETLFDVEAPLVLSEIDPALNNAADPAQFDMRNYKARHFLFNGKAYPQTDPIVAAAGQKVLLRYVNSGQQIHTIAVLGMYQQFLSLGGAQLPFTRNLTSEFVGPGEAADALATVPLAAQGQPEGINVPPTRYPLYEASMLLHNDGAKGASGMPLYGGMLTFIQTADDPGSPPGPVASDLALAPNPANGSIDVILTATVSDVGRGDNNVTAAEFAIDATTNPPHAMTGPFGTPTVNVQGTITVADMGGLAAGSHAIYVRGQDSLGNWGTYNFVTLNLDKAGPTTRSVALTPMVTDGNRTVKIQATGDDSASGGSNIAAAEYFIDPDPNSPPAPGTGTAMAVNGAMPVASLTATIPLLVMQGLAEGAHTLGIRSQDALGNWGEFSAGGMPPVLPVLPVDKTGPTAGELSIFPNPNNGQQGVNPITPSVRFSATLDDPLVNGAQSAIKRAEGFIDTVGSPGTGFPFTPLDGAFDSVLEDAYAFIPLTTINQLSEGNHNFFVRGRDLAGNWGTAVSTVFTLDKTSPVVSNVAVSPNPACGGNVTLSALANDSATSISAAEWFEGADPGPGKGNPMTVGGGAQPVTVSATFSVTSWAGGSHTLFVRARDGAGNWSTTGSVVLVVQADAIFADGFETGFVPPWSSVVGQNTIITRQAAAARTGAFGMRAVLNGAAPGYVQDTTPAAETTYHARFYFNPQAYASTLGPHFIFTGLRAGSNIPIFRVQYQRNNVGVYQVRAVVQRSGGTTQTPLVSVTSNAWHAIEIAWASGASASFSLYVDGVQYQLTGLNTSAFTLQTVRLGPSGQLSAGMTAAEFYDDFVSRRCTVIGP